MALSRIRASITATAPVASVTVSASGVVGVTPGVTLAAVTKVVPVANIRWINIVLDAHVDFRGLNPVVKDMTAVLDEVGLHIFKTAFSTTTSVDENTIVFMQKTPDEPLTAVDTVGYSLERTVTETLDATDDFLGATNADDDQTMLLVKSLAPEHQYVADADTIEFGKNLDEPKQAVDEITSVDVSKGVVEPLTVVESAGYHLQRSIADSADAGDEFNASFQTDDGQVMILSKTLPTEHQNVSDEAVLGAQKFRADDVSVGDELQPFVLGKGIEEPVQTTEAQVFDTAKPLADSATFADPHAVLAAKPLFDIANSQLEGPNLIEDYVEAGYFASQYVGNGGPAWDMTKPLTDTFATADDLSYTMAYSRVLSDVVDATDDFDGQTTAEDDQTMALVKSRSELVASADAHVFTVGVTKADAAQFSDALAALLGKPAVDDFLASDAATVGFAKGLPELVATSDSLNSINLSKIQSDNTLLDDSAAVNFETNRAETFLVSDASSRLTGKGLADEAGTGDSGSLRMTDYCDVLYFTDVYVGTSRNF